LFVTEGESDTIALRLAFPKCPVIGIPGASSWKPRWAKVTTDLFEVVYLCFDADEAGDGTYTGKEHQPKTNLLTEVERDVPHYRAVMLPKGADTRAFIQAIGLEAYKVLLRAADAAYSDRTARESLNRAMQERRQVEIAWERHSAS
jgi:DNA primase